MSSDWPETADDEPFEAASARLFRVAYRTAFRLLGSRGDAEDVAMEALARTAVRWKKLQPCPDPWTATVSANLSLDLCRRRKRAGRHRRPDPVELTGVDAQRIDLVRALERLPRRQRDTVVLRYLADLSEQQTATALGISTGSVKQHASRALAHLRRQLGEALTDD